MASINGSVATIRGGVVNPPGSYMTMTSNSSLSQTVTVTDSQTTQVFTGSGERTVFGRLDLTQVDLAHDWTITLQYTPSGGGALNASSLRNGGPYIIGKANFLIIVAENGDDADYNDCVCQLNWRS